MAALHPHLSRRAQERAPQDEVFAPNQSLAAFGFTHSNSRSWCRNQKIVAWRNGGCRRGRSPPAASIASRIDPRIKFVAPGSVRACADVSIAQLCRDRGERAMMSDERQRSVIWHGMLLFLLGLLTGLAEPHFINPRMGLAAHLEGLMNGTFLIALGAIWQYLKLPDRMLSRTYWFALYGAYANWATTTLAAIVGANSLSVITGTGHSALPWQETLVTLGFVSVGLAMLATSVLALWGLRRTIVA
jgi:hydroxylaminobenzene mutase